jgi:hypothetical protein
MTTLCKATAAAKPAKAQTRQYRYLMTRKKSPPAQLEQVILEKVINSFRASLLSWPSSIKLT